MNFLPFHIVLMSTAFMLALAGGLIARFGKSRKWWLKAHKALNISAAVIALCGISMAVLMVQSYEGRHFSSVHGIIGLIAGVWLTLQAIAGWLMVQPIMAGSAKKTRFIHRWSGRFLSLVLLANIILGLSKIL